MIALDDLAPPGVGRIMGLGLEWPGRRLFAVEPAQLWRRVGNAPRIRLLGRGGLVPLARPLLVWGTVLWEAQAAPRNAVIEWGGSAQFHALWLAQQPG